MNDKSIYGILTAPGAKVGVLCTADSWAVPLVADSQGSWDVPTGKVAVGESLTEAADRIVQQELDIRIQIGRPLLVEWWSEHTANDGAQLQVMFDGGWLTEVEVAHIKNTRGDILWHEYGSLLNSSVEQSDAPLMRTIERLEPFVGGRAREKFSFYQNGEQVVDIARGEWEARE